MFKSKNLFALISILLIVGIFLWINYLTKNKYIIECFQQSTPTSTYTPIATEPTTATVRQPINTRYSCKNMCGPMARCSITGEQCQSDVDCYGCSPMFKNPEQLKITSDVIGYNDAGKLGQRGLLYSQLTSDPVTREAESYPQNELKPPPQAYFGVNTWRTGFNEGMKYYVKRHGESPPEMVNMPKYPSRYSATGEFEENGPIAANSFQLN